MPPCISKEEIMQLSLLSVTALGLRLGIAKVDEELGKTEAVTKNQRV